MSLFQNQNDHPDDDDYDNRYDFSYALLCNDHGIEYMMRGEYHDAIRSFQRGLQYIKTMIDTTTTAADQAKRGNVTSPSSSWRKKGSSYHDSNSDIDVDVFSSDTMMMKMVLPYTDVGDGSFLRPILLLAPTIDDDGDDAGIALDRTTAIMLFNMGLCYVRSLAQNDDNDKALWHRAVHVFNLACNLLQGVQSQLQENSIIIDASTMLLTSYGIHQLESKTLSAMMHLWHHHHCRKATTVGDDAIIEFHALVEDRMEQVNQVLLQHRDMVHILCSLFINQYTTAPCA